MKLRNIYKMCMGLSLFLGVSPLFFLIVANIFSYSSGCGLILDATSISHCYDAGVLHSLFLLSIYWVLTLPIGLFSWCIFYFMYITAKK